MLADELDRSTRATSSEKRRLTSSIEPLSSRCTQHAGHTHNHRLHTRTATLTPRTLKLTPSHHSPHALSTPLLAAAQQTGTGTPLTAPVF